MKKSKTVIALGAFFIISSILGLRRIADIKFLYFLGFVFPKTFSIAWYLFWCLIGIVLGIGFIMHKYVFWKLVILKHIFFLIGYIINIIFISQEKISQMYNQPVNINSIYAFFTVNIIIGLLLLALIYSQKKAFQR